MSDKLELLIADRELTNRFWRGPFWAAVLKPEWEGSACVEGSYLRNRSEVLAWCEEQEAER